MLFWNFTLTSAYKFTPAWIEKVHKTFTRRPRLLPNVLCTFNLCPVSRRTKMGKNNCQISTRFCDADWNWTRLIWGTLVPQRNKLRLCSGLKEIEKKKKKKKKKKPKKTRILFKAQLAKTLHGFPLETVNKKNSAVSLRIIQTKSNQSLSPRFQTTWVFIFAHLKKKLRTEIYLTILTNFFHVCACLTTPVKNETFFTQMFI